MSDEVVIIFAPKCTVEISILVQFKFYSFIGETKQNKTRAANKSKLTSTSPNSNGVAAPIHTTAQTQLSTLSQLNAII
jgi:hypothetical protein